MSENITVGVAGNQPGIVATRWAAARASRGRKRLKLVHIVDPRIAGAGNPDLLIEAESAAARILQEAAEAALAVDAALEVETAVMTGAIIETLTELSKTSSLLVVGSNRGESSGRASGTHSVRVAAASESPVAVIPDVDLSGRRGVVVGVDGSDLSEHALAVAAEEASLSGEPLIPVHAWHAPNVYGGGVIVTGDFFDELRLSAEETLSLALAGLRGRYPDLEITPVVVEGIPDMAIVDAAPSASLVVVGSRGRGTFARLLLGSVSHGVLAHLETPTIVAK
ncbi:universal stress protein [Pseudoclavibacter sp. Z016]|uniref:universal stress protein n=1 Tax=Pseudoclavibacter sp. Z016 TaxID=2080581 RepID=UPI000CE7DD0E|nr:universal stress protein [Pseudoclavibacter sp. Z016]PPF76694.1 universal stress protein UspA [Pseudoclavibacter sp. Z016]